MDHVPKGTAVVEITQLESFLEGCTAAPTKYRLHYSGRSGLYYQSVWLGMQHEPGCQFYTCKETREGVLALAAQRKLVMDKKHIMLPTSPSAPPAQEPDTCHCHEREVNHVGYACKTCGLPAF